WMSGTPSPEAPDSLLQTPPTAEKRPGASGRIFDRGRGPELVGTRVTVYHVVEDLRCGYTKPEVVQRLGITEDDVQVLLAYIEEHRDDVNAEYDRILRRVNQPNPPRVDEGRARDMAELRKRILGRQTGKARDDRTGGQ